ncbi:DegV family protein with EDD domain [Flavimobilis soli]|uniref:DegV family protein with EDD domain n=1 Tax=Flavimobilis soli TaxID=442709 RepID=A0A2A9E8S1_9MICO|nr:DegV family protein [Flavimobilis soli]PFG35348.1 DegV family protein with EDD domain [Flavimobilis soli]
MSQPAPAVRVVTDSTASLPPSTLERLRMTIVPLHVHVGSATYLEGVDLAPDQVAALVAGPDRVTTSQPTPAMFAEAYARLADEGAQEIVSVHLSGELSGTVGAAELGAREVGVRVHVVDSRTAAGALGAAAEVAARAAMNGATGEQAAALARRTAGASHATFLVDSLDYLRRGGRLSRTASAIGGMLAMKPLLTVEDGRVEVLAKVRTRAAATDRLAEIARAQVRGCTSPVVTVHHLDSAHDAGELAVELTGATGVAARVTPVGAVLGAHVGPGLLAVVVADTDAG